MLIISINFISCSEDDSGSESTQESLLIGTWFLEGEIEDGVVQEVDDCEKQNSLQFTSSKRFIETVYYNMEGTDCVIDGIDDTGIWKIENGTIIINWPDADAGDDHSDSLSVIELTQTKLKFRQTYSDGFEDFTYTK
ncbi:lipocalin family protein [Antarcticibacterium sp. 1MA-6-2]|uniref:lipocalin family protein n=1 Tax=Antarcticibacterium sp. 1MA-6-2 TaxID=2908210 RepID=UPI001F1579E4|nr:lipocalin family protein [Antarcticibacterium sp. 1MA-6-2]UJH90933.1 lipocalin family protein [Antarcticibacterium sp. 1MA-6-2]